MKKQIHIKGKTVSYLEQGATDLETVVLVHGFPESSLLWKDILPTIEACGYRAIAPDLPAFGQSEKFDEPSTWERYVEFLDDFMTTLELTNVHLVVHDWGGLIGLRWAADHPERILSLVITDTSFVSDFIWHESGQIFRTPEAGERQMEALANPQLFHGLLSKIAPQETINDFHNIVKTAEHRAAALELYRSGDIDKLIPYRGKLAAIKKPAVIIFGENDTYVTLEYGYKLKEQELPQAEVHMIPNAGHFIHLEAPEAVCDILRQHFTKREQ